MNGIESVKDILWAPDVSIAFTDQGIPVLFLQAIPVEGESRIEIEITETGLSLTIDGTPFGLFEGFEQPVLDAFATTTEVPVVAFADPRNRPDHVTHMATIIVSK